MQTEISQYQKTLTVDNNQRIFYVHAFGWCNDHFVCNLKDLPACMKYFEGNEQYKVAHIWNNKLQYLSKKEVKEILAANKIPA